jgi:AraC family transcriptional regulator
MYRVTPSQWRNGGYTEFNNKRQTDSKIHQMVSKLLQDFRLPPFYIDTNTKNQIWRIKMESLDDVRIEVKELPELQTLYIRHTGPYKSNGALFERLFTKLTNWAGARNLLRFPETKFLSVYHDDPEITDDEKLRLSVCLTVEEDTPVDGEIGKMNVPGGTFAVGSFELSGSGAYERAWSVMMAGWLPDSGYQPDDRPCYEIYKNDPNTHPGGKHLVDICIPVKPL